MSKYDLPLPEWAVVGAKVWVQPDSYSRIPRFYEATITRMTKTSVFVTTASHSTGERRFSKTENMYAPRGEKPEQTMREYGANNGWRDNVWLYAGDSKFVASRLEASRKQAAQLKAKQALEAVFAYRQNGTEAERIDAAIAALITYRDLPGEL